MVNIKTLLEQKSLVLVMLGGDEENLQRFSYIYANSEFLDSLIAPINKRYSEISYLFNGKYYKTENFNIVPSEMVKEGSVLVNDDLKYQLQKGNIKNQSITIFVDNIYYNDEIELKILSTYTEKNFTKMTGYDLFSENRIFINEEDFNKLFKKPLYQSSIYVKDIDKINNTIKELNNIGITAKRVTDYKVMFDDFKKEVEGIKIAKLTLTIILVFTLFFISYFIIKIILKSRNTYYTTLRVLGAKHKEIKKIVYTELFINYSLAYVSVVFVMQLIKSQILYVPYFTKLISCLNITEYLLIYAIIFLMTKLLTRRFTRIVFKDPLISSYNEVV